MKKIYLSFVALLVATACFAQTQRLVLMEEFTQASCPPCAAYNPAFNAILNANSTKIVSIKYQVNWPGFDPMNVHNPSEVAARVSYYTVGGVPDGVMDGGSGTSTWHANPASFNATYINNRYAVASPFTMNVSHYFSPAYDVINVHVEITAAQAFSLPSNLRVAVIERDIHFCSPPGSNGETHFEGVMKKMLPNATGTALPATWTNGQVQVYDFQWTMTNVYDKNTLAVVAFVQNATSKEVHQTGYSDEQQLPDDARIICGGLTLPTVICGTTINPTVEFENLGSNTLTSLGINYQVDGGTVNTVPWSGSLASGLTATVNIPTINSSVGTHNISVTAVNPNATTDLNTYYDNSTRTFNAVANTGLPLPLVQDFVSAIFPPSGWTRVNPDNGYTWTRVGTGYNGANGSTKIDFYNSGAGQIDELWTPGYDFGGGIATAQLSFDVAYCQYSSEQDRIQVQVSIDCGQTWTDVWNYAGAGLAFGNAPYSAGAWTPTVATQWHHQIVSLNSYINNPNVFLRFKATSAFGNNGYIDNINVAVNVGINEPSLQQHVSLYPNPSEGKAYLDVAFDHSQDLKVEIYNVVGEKVNSFDFVNTVGGILPLDLSALANGSYVVKISTGGETLMKPLQITK
ncbi:MAG: T9SS type A sorting domain-containing protein [Bacteroidia bacterium]